MIRFIYQSKTVKVIAVFLAINLLYEIIFPSCAYALTSGPSQPEVQSFTPVGTSDMVDNFTGDFTYNIPLLDVGGYPINISYNSGITMDQEASFVGLGWNLNIGSINRNMRGLPDDFNGENVVKEFSMKDNKTVGVSGSANLEVLGFDLGNSIQLGVGVGLGISYNNYRGFASTININPALSAGTSNNGKLTLGLGISAGSETGVGIAPRLEYSWNAEYCGRNGERVENTLGLGLSINSRAGMRDLTLSYSKSQTLDRGKTARNKDLPDHTGSIDKEGSLISFSSPSYVPSVANPTYNLNLSLAIKLGAEAGGVFANGKLSGYYSTQAYLVKSQTVPAYGYLYLKESTANTEGATLMDFNREKDGSYTENTTNLALSNMTYDIYSVAGQGMSGMFRPYRNDIGYVHDNKALGLGGGIDVSGIEVGFGSGAHGGVNIDVNGSDSYSGMWTGGNSISSNFRSAATNNLFEPWYFKQVGEKNAESDPSFISSLGGYDPVRVKLNDGGGETVTALNTLKSFGPFSSGETTIPSHRNEASNVIRQPRNQCISILTRSDAAKLSLTRTNYSYNDFTYNTITGGYYTTIYSYTNQSSVNYGASGHDNQIAVITAARPDGMRYVYGLPVNNTVHHEATFAVRNGEYSHTGQVDYTAGEDNPLNQSGKDWYYSKTKIPEYTYAYMLTQVLSPDYVDMNGNNIPDAEDLGTWTKINYTRTTSTNTNYKWRVPFNKLKANFDEGQLSDPNDNKGSYLYGEKEIWYVHSIETPTHIAEFVLEDREDCVGVANNQGGPSTTSASGNQQKRLKEIRLYTRVEKESKGANAVPVKVVHFTYDYSLCDNIDNSTSSNGKLTLKEIYFTYGNSNKARLSPYRFSYADNNHDLSPDANPNYDIKGYDRWGFYKPNDPAIPNAECPYVKQGDQATADDYVASWNLTRIELPSGGTIDVTYESDDYAYVQNTPAMQMFNIAGFNNGTDATTMKDSIYNKAGNNDDNLYVFWELAKSKSGSYITDISKYLKDLTAKEVYFKCKTKINREQATNGIWEYVPGYFKIDGANYGYSNGNGGKVYGYVKMQTVPIGENNDNTKAVSPIARTAWNWARLNRPELVYEGTNATTPPDDILGNVVGLIKSIAVSFEQFLIAAQGVNRNMRMRKFGKIIKPSHSWVKLYNPDGYKLGGGSRVKEIRLSDNWYNLTGYSYYGDGQQGNGVYGQKYDYTMKDSYGNTISSGVASAEPMVGGDETAYRYPVFVNEDVRCAPDNDHYLEGPFGEGFYPSPSVGYRRVTITNFTTRSDVNKTGSVVKEYYTTYDFPTITRQTPIDAIRKKSGLLGNLLKLNVHDYMTVSQGYVIELNDMNGKEKAEWVYKQGNNDPISGVEYFYRTKQFQQTWMSQNYNITSLNNVVPVLKRDNSITNQTVGVDVDFSLDMREQRNRTMSGGASFNMDIPIPFPPIPVLTFWPSFSREKTRFRSVVATKIVNRFAILERTVAHDLGSSVETKNTLWDAETGEVLLTKTQNAFNDTVYSFNYPAHFCYDGMGSAFRNTGAVFSGSLSNGTLTTSGYTNMVAGDELLVSIIGGNSQRLWVVKIVGSDVWLRDKNGLGPTLSGSVVALVIRSGRRNMQTTSVGSVTTLASPIYNGAITLSAEKLVLQAGAIEYGNQWKTMCTCIRNADKGATTTSVMNPYLNGIQGVWRQKKSYTYLTNRTQSTYGGNNNLSVRKDGVFETFTPYWTPQPTSSWTPTPTNWTWTSEVTEYLPQGLEAENKNALGVFSSALYELEYRLPKAVANNATAKDIFYDGFERFNYYNYACDNGWGVKELATSKTTRSSHTGRTSLYAASTTPLIAKFALKGDCNDQHLTE